MDNYYSQVITAEFHDLTDATEWTNGTLKDTKWVVSSRITPFTKVMPTQSPVAYIYKQYYLVTIIHRIPITKN